MTTIDGIVITAGIAILAVLSLRAMFSHTQGDDYFTGGQSGSAAMLTFFSYGAGTCGDSPGVIAASTWRSGMSGLWWQFIWLILTPFFWILAPVLRRLRAVTTADFFLVRFGRSTAILYSFFGVLISIVIISGVLFGTSRLLNAVTNPLFDDLAAELNIRYPMINLSWASNQRPLIAFRPLQGDALAAIALAILLSVLGMAGGLRAGMLIDCLQGILQIGVTLILLPVLYSRMGGFGSLGRSAWLKPGMLDFLLDSQSHRQFVDPMTPLYVAVLGIAGLLGMLAHPHLAVVCASVPSERHVRAGFTAGNLLKRILSIMWGLFGLGCITLYLGAQSPLLTKDQPASLRLQQDLQAAANAGTQELSATELNRLETVERRFSDRVFGVAMRDLLSRTRPGILGLAALMLIATSVSHAAIQMVTGSGLISVHIFRNYLMPERHPQFYLLVGRISGLVIVCFAVLLQMTFHDIGDFLRLFIQIPAIIGLSMWMGIFWTRWNSVSVWTSALTGSVVALLCTVWPMEIWQVLPALRETMFVESGGGLVLLNVWALILTMGSAIATGTAFTFVAELNQEDLLEFFYRAIQTRVRPRDSAVRITEFQFSEDDIVIPSYSLLGLQIPGPTREGTAGFFLVAAVVGVVIVCTKIITVAL